MECSVIGLADLGGNKLYFIIAILKLIIILGVVTTIHEFGHFIFSKIFKIGVNEFAVGFGPVIYQKKYKDTMYSLRAIPLGGFCAIEGEDGDSEKENSFAKKNIFQKIVVLVMGATFNAILACVIFVTIAFVTPTYTTTITGLEENSVLAKAGVSVGDKIISIDGKKVNLQSELFSQNYDMNKSSVTVEYLHNGQLQNTVVEDAIKEIGYIGVSFKIAEDEQSVTNVIDMIASGGSSVNAGLKSGDKIVSINGTPTNNSSDIITIIRQHPNQDVNMQIERNGQMQDKTLHVDSKKMFDLNITGTEKVKTTLPLAFASAYDNAKTIISSYVDLFKGKVGIKDMSGIVGLGEVVYKTEGVLEFFNLMAIISLAVGVANLLPFPPLDGGKVVIVTCEAILRKKLPANAEAIISYIGFGLLILLTIVVTYNDLIRIF